MSLITSSKTSDSVPALTSAPVAETPTSTSVPASVSVATSEPPQPNTHLRHQPTVTVQRPPLHKQLGISSLHAISSLIVSGILMATAVEALTPLLDQADHNVAQHALSAELTHQYAWQTYAHASGNPSLSAPDPLRHGLVTENDLVHSPLAGYCFSPDAPASGLAPCPVAESSE